MKRLFMLRYATSSHPFMGIPKSQGPLCFPNKKEAKERRDEVNALHLGYELRVSPGPDHNNFKS